MELVPGRTLCVILAQLLHCANEPIEIHKLERSHSDDTATGCGLHSLSHVLYPLPSCYNRLSLASTVCHCGFVHACLLLVSVYLLGVQLQRIIVYIF